MSDITEDKAAHNKTRELLNTWVFKAPLPNEKEKVEVLKRIQANNRDNIKWKTLGSVTAADGNEMLVMACLPQKVSFALT